MPKEKARARYVVVGAKFANARQAVWAVLSVMNMESRKVRRLRWLVALTTGQFEASVDGDCLLAAGPYSALDGSLPWASFVKCIYSQYPRGTRPEADEMWKKADKGRISAFVGISFQLVGTPAPKIPRRSKGMVKLGKTVLVPAEIGFEEVRKIKEWRGW